VFPVAVLAATVWTWVDENGRRHYSDRPTPGATEIEIGESQTFSGSALSSAQAPTASPAQTAPSEPTLPAAPVYSILDVISPEAGEDLWNIGGSLPVTVVTFPALAGAHQIDIMLDDERRNLDTRALQIVVPDVFRGEHTLQALIVDASGEILMRSSPITIYVHQTSIQN
jgi:hypothetical protein